MSSNRIRFIPDEIGVLKKLHTLNLTDNQIYLLPDSLSKLNNLNDLRIKGNKFRKHAWIPDEINGHPVSHD